MPALGKIRQPLTQYPADQQMMGAPMQRRAQREVRQQRLLGSEEPAVSSFRAHDPGSKGNLLNGSPSQYRTGTALGIQQRTQTEAGSKVIFGQSPAAAFNHVDEVLREVGWRMFSLLELRTKEGQS